MTAPMPAQHERIPVYNAAVRDIHSRLADWWFAEQLSTAQMIVVLVACQHGVAQRVAGAARADTPPVNTLDILLVEWQDEVGLTDVELLAILADAAEQHIWRLVRDERNPNGTKENS